MERGLVTVTPLCWDGGVAVAVTGLCLSLHTVCLLVTMESQSQEADPPGNLFSLYAEKLRSGGMKGFAGIMGR